MKDNIKMYFRKVRCDWIQIDEDKVSMVARSSGWTHDSIKGEEGENMASWATISISRKTVFLGVSVALVSALLQQDCVSNKWTFRLVKWSRTIKNASRRYMFHFRSAFAVALVCRSGCTSLKLSAVMCRCEILFFSMRHEHKLSVRKQFGKIFWT